ncbi:MAG: sigma factor-like helix-turn-helix DNA-binding protein, partial [Candidatus Cloacimonadota bacterium]|nr:sigma factor-like helix-turn-helix DNA-binding protein [Candidatus Cloacimonadota bacterium]
ADHKQQVDARIESSITFPSAMPDLERGVLQLSLNEGLALKEVASRLGISVERVKQLRGKALRRLRS